MVVGAGPIGLACVASLRAYGVPRIAAIDLDEGRLVQARSLGATETFVAGNDAGVKAARFGTSTPDTDGADVVFDAEANGIDIDKFLFFFSAGAGPWSHPHFHFHSH